MRWRSACSGEAGDTRSPKTLTGPGPIVSSGEEGIGRNSKAFVLVATVAGSFLLNGCESTNKVGDFIKSSFSEDPQTTSSIAKGSETVGLADPEAGGPTAAPGLLGSDSQDDLSLGKKYFRSGNHGLAERHFRRAVEAHPNDGEAWLGLAASYDQLRRFELADRAYAEVTKIVGRSPEVLNNKGYSYILRGDYGRARQALMQAKAMDPSNQFVQNNLDLLAKSARKRKGVEN
jgi:Flp pilus assembly protein TadD